MMPRNQASAVFIAAFIALFLSTQSASADPLAYLNEPCDPYYVGLDFPKLTTPQWYGEDGVEAVVILSIDDMKNPDQYEKYLRPILNRLDEIYDEAPLSIFANSITADDPKLQPFLKEGLTIEAHTVDHPCPLLSDSDFAKAKSTYDRCVDTLAKIPNSKSVAFRMPCCDSLNTPSPRFWKEIFEKKSPDGNYLTIDSSVFNITTAADPDLPKNIATNKDDQSRFRRYLPFKSYVNTIEDYPYPYIIGQQCWEFPCMVPSDWEAQNIQKPFNPDTVRDMKHALDATVAKQGTMTICFHPWGWIRAEQMVELINHAQTRYGKKVKFIQFADAASRLNNHLLDGHPIRNDEGATGVRMVDLDRDGYLDVVAPLKDGTLLTKIWDNKSRTWNRNTARIPSERMQFGTRKNQVTLLAADPDEKRLRTFKLANQTWTETPTYVYSDNQSAMQPRFSMTDQASFQLTDFDGDGTSELIVTNNGESSVFVLDNQSVWKPSAYGLPAGTRLLTKSGQDAGLRFRDINGDSKLDAVFANGRDYSVHLFDDSISDKTGRKTGGWKQTISGKSGGPAAMPAIVRGDGTNNGAWFHSDHMWVQNEQTDRMDAKVDRFSFAQMLGKKPAPKPAPAVDSGDKAAAADPDIYPPAKSTEEALAAFAPRDGIRFELVASEPQIEDPVAFDWSGDGSLWVAEMRDYPNGISWNKQGDPVGEPGGRIKLLRDKDNDGKFETATIFLDNIPFPNGVKAWRKGVLVTAAPYVFYAEDTNGDGQADLRENLFEGFGKGNQQHRVNGMRWGLDQWLHLANGDSGGSLRAVGKPDTQPVNIGGRDIRIQPDLRLVQAQSGQTQSGRSRDDHGNWFGGNNSSPVWHYALSDRYLSRNPHYSPPGVRHEIAAIPGAAPIFPTSKTVTRFNDFDRANRYTSACSPEVFRDDHARSVDPRRFVYVCEPVHNMIGREVIVDDGLTFHSERAASEQDRELIASSDNWFRPVMARTGPDGALWVADMYRLVIEHPEWIPKDWQDRLDIRGGTDKGRIYRVVFDATEKTFAGTDWQQLDQLPTEKLVAAMDTANGTLRDMIHQRLYWQSTSNPGDKASITLLQQLVDRRGSEVRSATARNHAVHLLDSLGELDDARLARAIGSDGSLSRHAMRVAESRLDKSPELQTAILRRATKRPKSGENLRTIQQAAYSLGECESPEAGTALASIAIDYANDPWMVATVMSSVNENNIDAFAAKLREIPFDNQPNRVHSDILAMAVAMKKWSIVNEALSYLGNDNNIERRIAATAGIMKTIRRKNIVATEVLSKDANQSLHAVACLARYRANQPRLATAERIAAIRLFGAGDAERSELESKRLLELLNPQTPNEVQLAAIDRMGDFDLKTLAPAALEKWNSLSPGLRNRTLDVLLSRDAGTQAVLDAASSGKLPTQQIGAGHRQRMLDNKTFAEQARSVFGRASESTRSDVLKRYASVLTLNGDRENGKQHFAKNCSTCHQLDGTGHSVGPDLSALTDKSATAMLTAILDPNRAVEDKYLSYLIITNDGRQYSGLLTAETSTAITLVMADGKSKTILRSEIEVMKSTGKSHMPEGLEQDLPPQAITDIVAYVQSITVPPKTFAGNQPQVAPVRDDGSIRLFAMHARIYGPAIEFEPQYRNLGMWSHENDRAVWRLNVPKAGEYSVTIDYACSADCSGNRIQVSSHGQKLVAEVPSTGSWDNYSSKTIGRLQLPQGEVEVTLKAADAISHFLGDFRTIILEPR